MTRGVPGQRSWPTRREPRQPCVAEAAIDRLSEQNQSCFCQPSAGPDASTLLTSGSSRSWRNPSRCRRPYRLFSSSTIGARIPACGLAQRRFATWDRHRSGQRLSTPSPPDCAIPPKPQTSPIPVGSARRALEEMRPNMSQRPAKHCSPPDSAQTPAMIVSANGENAERPRWPTDNGIAARQRLCRA